MAVQGMTFVFAFAMTAVWLAFVSAGTELDEIQEKLKNRHSSLPTQVMYFTKLVAVEYGQPIVVAAKNRVELPCTIGPLTMNNYMDTKMCGHTSNIRGSKELWSQQFPTLINEYATRYQKAIEDMNKALCDDIVPLLRMSAKDLAELNDFMQKLERNRSKLPATAKLHTSTVSLQFGKPFVRASKKRVEVPVTIGTFIRNFFLDSTGCGPTSVTSGPISDDLWKKHFPNLDFNKDAVDALTNEIVKGFQVAIESP